MKTNAPEKIYLSPSGVLYKGDKQRNNDIEYTRTDAFISKACEWLKNFNDFHNIMRYSDCCEVPLDQFIDDFKKYMEE